MTRVIALFTLWIAAVAWFMATAPVQAADIAGKYGCVGKGPDGKSYEVDLLVEKHNDAYGLTWSIGGETTGIGVGLVKSGVLSAIFQTTKAIGLVTYSIGKNGLDGTWTVPQLDGVVMPETCTLGSGPAKAA